MFGPVQSWYFFAFVFILIFIGDITNYLTIICLYEENKKGSLIQPVEDIGEQNDLESEDFEGLNETI